MTAAASTPPSFCRGVCVCVHVVSVLKMHCAPTLCDRWALQKSTCYYLQMLFLASWKPLITKREKKGFCHYTGNTKIRLKLNSLKNYFHNLPCAQCYVSNGSYVFRLQSFCPGKYCAVDLICENMSTAKTLTTNHVEKYTHTHTHTHTPFTIHKCESVRCLFTIQTQKSTAHYGCISGGKMHQSSFHTISLDRSFVLVNKHNVIHPLCFKLHVSHLFFSFPPT